MQKKFVRREVLRLVAGGGAVALAGCLGGSDEGTTDDVVTQSPASTGDDATETATATPTASETATPEPNPSATAWAQAYGDAANSGFAAEGNATTGVVRWTAKLDGRLQAPPVVFGDRLFTVAGKTLAAHARGDGSEQWTRTFGATLEHAAACTDETLLVAADKLYALEPATGKTRWESGVGAGPRTDLTVHDGVVYFGAADSKVYGLRVADGEQVARSALFPHGGVQTPAVDDSGVVVTASDEVTGLNKRGAQQWDHETESTVNAPPTIAGDVVYAGTSDGDLRCLDRSTGSKRWSVSFESSILTPPSVSDEGVFVVAGQTLHCVDPESGDVRWSQRVDDATLTAPSHAPGIVYVGSAGHRVFALDAANGETLWSKKTGHPIVVAPVLVADDLYVGTSDGTLYTFE
ncbi:outer membrane protein assembly factor BamB family protein [Halogranum rubrum]|uniref:Pyrrolo-quinoline quinone repeat domain-containing protein n=1 Tax=Halogranum salarium B-1 TaxID=1210908 RepID=J3A5Q2_9EURY|nr:PQQ-binding-like beta-propeller repeat protein [Halogranum salarium]EJN60783.1 hypothetical protein HSB1_13860 [Halogranum salarium B-1]